MYNVKAWWKNKLNRYSPHHELPLELLQRPDIPRKQGEKIILSRTNK